MEEKNIEELLNEEIAAQIEALSDLQSGSKEKSTAIDDLTKLYKLRSGNWFMLPHNQAETIFTLMNLWYLHMQALLVYYGRLCV